MVGRDGVASFVEAIGTLAGAPAIANLSDKDLPGSDADGAGGSCPFSLRSFYSEGEFSADSCGDVVGIEDPARLVVGTTRYGDEPGTDPQGDCEDASMSPSDESSSIRVSVMSSARGHMK
jgi:hypothetical protein